MSTTKKGKKETGIAKLLKGKSIGELSFDDMAGMDEKERKQLINQGNLREGKRLQLAAKINDLNGKITKTETAYAESILDATVDSVDLIIKLKCWKEERTIAINLYNQLFPENPLPNK